MTYICFAYAMVCCFLFLRIQLSHRKSLRLQRELDIQSVMMSRREEQFQREQANVELLNQLCHRLKHHVADFISAEDEETANRSLAQFEQVMEDYDSAVETHNPVLDTILAEKKLYSQTHNITWLCVADGRQSDFISAADLYTLLGSALDNAVECVSMLPDPSQRLIDVKVYTRGQLLLMQVKNYYTGTLAFRGGLPVSTKTDRPYRGYGLSMIRQTAEKYGGCMTIQTDDHLFSLQIMIPLPQEA